jgi:hypothetical protein
MKEKLYNIVPYALFISFLAVMIIGGMSPPSYAKKNITENPEYVEAQLITEFDLNPGWRTTLHKVSMKDGTICYITHYNGRTNTQCLQPNP